MTNIGVYVEIWLAAIHSNRFVDHNIYMVLQRHIKAATGREFNGL